LGIDHCFCDPDEDDRKRLGIPYYADIRDDVRKKYGIIEGFPPENKLRKRVKGETNEISKKYWGLRELFWFNRISRRIGDGVLFICGHEHVERFKLLVKRHDYSCRILNYFWQKHIFSDLAALPE